MHHLVASQHQLPLPEPGNPFPCRGPEIVSWARPEVPAMNKNMIHADYKQALAQADSFQMDEP